jgi:molecular chaperone GrpE
MEEKCNKCTQENETIVSDECTETTNAEYDNSDGETLAEAEKNEDKEFEGIDEDCVPESKINELNAVIEDIKDSNRKLSEENIKLQNELDAMKDKLVRNSAEYENYRKRTSKEKEGIYTDACEDVLKNIFPVLDNLERAAVTEGSMEDLRKGIEMTLRQFKDALDKLQVEEISTNGEFDPNLHNAVMHIEDTNFGKNSIAEVFQKGYKKANKVLRYSMVKVAN